MSTLIVKSHGRRALVALLIVAVLAYLFWTGSRYPSLDDKALMSGAIQLEDPLSFEAHYPLSPDMPVYQRIFLTTLNWLFTNQQGMTFGILFAAALLTLAGNLRQRSFKNGFLNAVMGLGIGAPLGVCVNCAAPIAKGLYAGGARAETTLAAMIASPTLNIVVLTMTFSILPFYMAAAKIVLSLGLILIGVPLICRLLPQRQLQVEQPYGVIPEPQGWDTAPIGEDLATATLQTAVSYLKNLWFIVRLTVPLMFLAGFLGAVVATLLPGDLVTDLKFALPALLFLVLVGTFLPVPIAFDVVVTGALLAGGMDPGYVMALLFTLGSFSVYSFFIVAQTISLRAALLLGAAVMLAGLLGGAGGHFYHNWQTQRALEQLLSGNLFISAANAQSAPASDAGLLPPDGQITVTSTPFNSRSPAAELPFTRLEAHEIGIDKPNEFSFRDMWPPFWEGRSLSSGDIDRDGDIDLVIASTERGLYIYESDGTGQFTRVELDIGALAQMPVFNAALVDADNDGFLDLFITTYRQGNYLWHNTAGSFLLSTPPAPVKNRDDAVLTIALSFADVDRNGFLDVALGNWAAGWYRRVPGEESRNRLLLNTTGTLDGQTFADLPAIPGETLSILFSDFSGDGRPDLLVGNDFEIPDAFYQSRPDGILQLITQQDGLIPHTTTTTMAVKTADLFNTDQTQIYLAQIAGRSSGASDRLKMQPLARYCDSIKSPTDHATCAANMAIKTWYKSGNNFDPTYAGRCQTLPEPAKSECKAILVKDLAIQKDDPRICDLIPAKQHRARSFCSLHFLPIRQRTQAEIAASIPQILRQNVLLERDSYDQPFTDTAEKRRLDVGGWSWDTKIADFDNDGWQDVYIVNGTWVPNEVSPSNLFYHNLGDGSFAEASGPFGLQDYLMTATATVFDADNDGDLDILTHTVNGPITYFRNNDQSGHSIAFALQDYLGNRDGIGAKLTLYYGPNGEKRQSREVQLGGGFMSFDAPKIHFGLGAETSAHRLDIRWPDGALSTINGPFEANTLHTLKRTAPE